MFQKFGQDNGDQFFGAIVTAVKEIVHKVEQSFGGCKKCYGKGYSTELVKEEKKPLSLIHI